MMPNRFPSGFVLLTAVLLCMGSVACDAPAPSSDDVSTRDDIVSLNLEALDHHRARRLSDASRRYQRVLELEPIPELTEGDEALILRLAPVLHVHGDEPFGLDDVVAILHPDSAVVAYHLFWDDDIDFPDDNEPTDHEVVWVSFDPTSREPTLLRTYFHGGVARAELTPTAEDGSGVRPGVFVEWGKHGSLPAPDLLLPGSWPEALEENWRVLNTTGTRRQGHPLAAGWPTRFERDFDTYRRASGVIDGRDALQARRTMARTRWGNAALDQHFLPYNFSPKPAWPWEITR
jgi:hypothetical protein